MPKPCAILPNRKMKPILTALSLFVAVFTSANYRTLTDEQITYGIFQAAPEEIRLHWQDAQGTPYGSLTRLKNALQSDYQIKLLMNAGIYTQNHTPAGLWIENGRELQPLNLKRGKGNFHLQPNGVFVIADKKASIFTSTDYQKQKIKPTFALQSGPMLIIQGRMNDQFGEQKASYYKRNAVCLDKQGNVLFVLTIEGRPNLYTFSQGLLKIGCQNALYLDGAISDWYIPNQFSGLHWRPFVGMISVLETHKK